jgi:hypothetical protein
VAGPATHAIVIGVGAYPHLVGGKRGQLTPSNEGMGQLTSPGPSARAVADWLISNLNDENKPLATVALLLSEAKPERYRNPRSGREHAVKPAVMANVKPAVREWKDRAQDDDRVLFYFCGHGIAAGTRASLLLADFGEEKDDVLAGAIDFTRLLQGLEHCKARQQCFFIDACRANSETALGAEGYMGNPIVKPDAFSLPVPAPPPRIAPVYYSTVLGQDAYGIPGARSPFTDSLLRSLAGAGSDRREGDWRVSTTGLQGALDFLMAQAFPPGSPRAQVPNSNSLSTFYFHYLAAEPEATVFVSCRPNEATGLAELAYQSEGAAAQARPGPSSEAWELALVAGDYEFSAHFPGGGYANAAKKLFVDPPYQKVPLEV